eukprot:283239-Pleurochrysis_carterae.AAC.1
MSLPTRPLFTSISCRISPGVAASACDDSEPTRERTKQRACKQSIPHALHASMSTGVTHGVASAKSAWNTCAAGRLR